MDRRKLLRAASTGLTLPALFSPMLFSVTPAFAEGESKPKMGSDTYEKSTLLIGSFSKSISEMASQKAKNKMLREFAGYEIAEQTAIAEVLKNELDPKPPNPTDKQQEMLHKLGNETGESFDKAYIKAEIEGHEQLLALQKAYLDIHGFKSDGGHIAKLAETVIDMHLAMLHNLQAMVG